MVGAENTIMNADLLKLAGAGILNAMRLGGPASVLAKIPTRGLRLRKSPVPRQLTLELVHEQFNWDLWDGQKHLTSTLFFEVLRCVVFQTFPNLC